MTHGTGPDEVGLLFGVGMADEPLPMRGITHLCEHLAFSRIDRHRHTYNGWVTANATAFMCRGSIADTVDFLGSICDGIRQLPADRVEVERRILRAEAESRGGRTRFESSLVERFGAASYGRVGYREYGLQAVDMVDLTAWMEEHFHAGNCAIWITGSEPGATASALEVDLREGHARTERRYLE